MDFKPGSMQPITATASDATQQEHAASEAMAVTGAISVAGAVSLVSIYQKHQKNQEGKRSF